MPARAMRSIRARRLFCTAVLTAGAIVTGTASGAEAAASECGFRYLHERQDRFLSRDPRQYES
jgi:hypothetical protein